MVRLVLAVALSAPLVASAEVDSPSAGAPPAFGVGDPAPAPPPPPSAPATAARSGVYFGAGVGATAFSGRYGGEHGASSVRMRVGMARSPRLMFGLEGGFDDGNVAELSWYDVGATFFPWERFFFVRGGVGLTLVSTWTPASGGGYSSVGQGPNVLAGIGCAFSGRPGINLSLNLEVQRHVTGPAGGSFPERGSSSVSAWVGLDWY